MNLLVALIDDIENGAEYLKALHWAIRKRKLKILHGHLYMVRGKSSIIDTYLKKT